MNYPQRKIIRLKYWDYSENAAYFVTICTQDRACFLSDITVGALHEAPAAKLTKAGIIVQNVIESLPERYPDIKIDNYVIMPNHVHLLLQIDRERAIHESPLQEEGKRSLLSQVIGYLKMNSSKEIHALYPERKVWQRSYHEHVVRNNNDYHEIWNYIDTNPAKWANDRYALHQM